MNCGAAANGGYDSASSRYSTNSYNSDHRYKSPYASSYDNGITTASLSLGSATKGSNPYLNKNSSSSSSRSLSTAKPLSSSNSSLNAYPSTSGSSSTPNAAAMAAIVSRSSSLREQERKSRTRSRSRTAAQRSLSASSEKSEGYEVRWVGGKEHQLVISFNNVKSGSMYLFDIVRIYRPRFIHLCSIQSILYQQLLESI